MMRRLINMIAHFQRSIAANMALTTRIQRAILVWTGSHLLDMNSR